MIEDVDAVGLHITDRAVQGTKQRPERVGEQQDTSIHDYWKNHSFD